MNNRNPNSPQHSNAYSRRVRKLNDQLRMHGEGGRVMITRGIADEPPEVLERIMNAVRRYDIFTEDNDPHGEHDFGRMVVAGITVMWKIDYYDRSGVIHSPDPADPTVTLRVLTVMRAEEY